MKTALLLAIVALVICIASLAMSCMDPAREAEEDDTVEREAEPDEAV